MARLQQHWAQQCKHRPHATRSRCMHPAHRLLELSGASCSRWNPCTLLPPLLHRPSQPAATATARPHQVQDVLARPRDEDLAQVPWTLVRRPRVAAVLAATEYLTGHVQLSLSQGDERVQQLPGRRHKGRARNMAAWACQAASHQKVSSKPSFFACRFPNLHPVNVLPPTPALPSAHWSPVTNAVSRTGASGSAARASGSACEARSAFSCRRGLVGDAETF